MIFFYFGLMLYIISFNQALGNISWIEQKFTYALMTSEQDTILEELFNDNNGNEIYDLTEPFTDRNNNNQYDYAEDFIDVNNNGKYDYQENYQDDNQNGIWDNEEPYTDLNNNGLFDFEEPFTDHGNGVYDIGEDFIDVNNNNIWDGNLWYVDRNNNKKWDDGESFEDLNNNNKRDFNENYTDKNKNYRYDGPEEIGDSKFNYFAEEFIESYTDAPNGRYDLGEKFEDLNGDGQWTAAEEYEDKNGDGQWTAAEEYEDFNNNGLWDKVEAESITYDSLMTSEQDIAIDKKTNAELKPYQSSVSFKSPGKALIYSGVLPGLGQAYMGNWKRSLLYIAIDISAIGIWYQNNKLVKPKANEFKLYEKTHWDFSQWIHDYYKWYEYDDNNPASEWNLIREAFINRSDSIANGGTYAGCAEDPTQGYCYIDIWDKGHSVDFYWEGVLISSNEEDKFKDIYQELCDNQNLINRDCKKDIEEIRDIVEEKSLIIDKNHHFYEGIQKYDEFFSGWDDNDDIETKTNPNTSLIVTSPHQQKYQALWNEADRIKKLAMLGGKFMLINRFVSMVDALLLAKKWNNDHDLKLSLNAYPDLRNKSGVGGLKLSLRWK